MTTTKTVLFFVIVLICVTLVAIYAASETALNSINLIRFNTILHRQKKLAKFKNKKLRRKIVKSIKIKLLIKEYMITISSIAIISNIITITASTVSIFFFSQFFTTGKTAEYVSWVALTLAIIVFGEIIPKFIGRNWPEKTVVALFFFYYYSYWLFAPLLKFLDHVLKIKRRSFVTRDELMVIIKKMYEEGMISKTERKLTENILSFEKKSVSNIYIKKHQINFMHPNELKLPEINFLYKIFAKETLPIVERNTGKFIGFFNYKKYFKLMLTPTSNITKKQIFEKCIDSQRVIRNKTSVSEAYSKISKTKNHLVAVVDNYISQTFLGLLDDKMILASLVNKQFAIAADNENFLYQQISNDVFLVNSKCNIEMVFNHIINIPEVKTKFKTIDEFLIDLNKGEVKKYESVFFRNYEFKKYLTEKDTSFYEVTRNEIIIKKTVL